MEIPLDHKKINSRALILQHCKDIDPIFLKNMKTNNYIILCPACKLTVTGSTNTIAVNSWNTTMRIK